jgi:hypothetical protein
VDVLKNQTVEPYLILKHDVETNVPHAYKLAEIENKYGHRGSYYVQAYLIEDKNNIALLKKMQRMGHEISYHYDVMDSNKGDILKAIAEFRDNKDKFEREGFHLNTVCQHGNPVVERIGYTSNRDFFRNITVQEEFQEISDIMVNFKVKASTDYVYYSDAGRRFKMIFDPINNDVINSDDKNIEYDDLNEVFDELQKRKNSIISIHPHRWVASVLEYVIKTEMFKFIKGTAKLFLHIPFMKKIMSKYYYLAKKI